MKHINLFSVICLFSIGPIIASAQVDSTKAKMDTMAKKIDTMANKIDTMHKPVADTTKVVAAMADTAVISVPMNCYKQWIDYFTELGSKPVPDGTQMIVIAFKNKESCHCYMGKVDVVGGKIKTPVYVETEG